MREYLNSPPVCKAELKWKEALITIEGLPIEPTRKIIDAITLELMNLEKPGGGFSEVELKFFDGRRQAAV
jgi:hypothetical protein